MNTENNTDSPEIQGEVAKPAKINVPEMAQAIENDKERLDFEEKSGVIVVNIDLSSGDEDKHKVAVLANCDFDSLPPEVATALELGFKMAANLLQSSLELGPRHMSRFMKRKMAAGLRSLIGEVECNCEECQKKEGEQA